MAKPAQDILPDELARRLDAGEPLQVLDVRSPQRVARGHIALGGSLEFHAVPGSRLLALASPEAAGLDPRRPVAVVCGHGNSSTKTAAFLRDRGFEAYSVRGGMAAWETVYVARDLTPTMTIDRIVQLDRVGKGALSYVLVSGGDAVLVDPGRHVERYEAIMTQSDARPVAVVETHMHADYLSGARAAAARWNVPYRVHAADTRSPYDGTPGTFAFADLAAGDRLTFGRASFRTTHTPGHTLGSVTLISDDGLALTGDFMFVRSLGRPDLGGQAADWAKQLWASLERARQEWPGQLVILPAHYADEVERRADRTVAARWDVITATNPGVGIHEEGEFLRWIAEHTKEPPAAYRTIKLANLGLQTVSDHEAETLESGPNVCAI